MNRSEQINELMSALAKAQEEMPAANKTGYNPHFKSKFADYPDMVAASRPALTKNGLSVVHCINHEDGMDILITILGHSSGQFITSRMKITSEKATVQSIGSAITYLKRYCYAAIVGLASREKEDDDGAAATSHEGPKLTLKQVEELSDLFLEWPALKKHVFQAENVDRWEDIQQNVVPDILEFFTKETQ